ncbi:MAG: hypothetical protein CW716_03405 [Candidatus Bathyarchaeum sp.]|nr:MAG: hypothetical protein CW716_03405 [Candidatus Bathyarchaeum sp.]
MEKEKMINLYKVHVLERADRTKISTFTLILLLAMSLMMAFAQPSFAQIGVSQPVETSGYITVAPTLIGVGQTATVNLWTFPMPTNYLYNPYYGGFTGVTVTFTKPDGTQDSFMPVDGTGQFDPGQTQSLGAIYFFYTPDRVGEWSVSFTMPEQNITDATGTVIYQPCTSNTFQFTVQEDLVYAGLLCGYPWSELPDEDSYWSYPISSNNREWYQMSGDWLQGRTSFYAMAYSSFSGVTARNWQPYGPGPNTGHILWTQPLRAGGLIGGDYGSLSYYLPDYAGSVVIQGKLIRNIPNGQFECVDLTSGEVLYTAPGSISCGIHLPGNAYAQSMLDPSVVLASSMGNYVTPYLFTTSGTTWNYIDPCDGTVKRSLTNGGVGFKLVDGTNLAYGIASGNLTGWDMSKVVGNDWPTGITWTTPLPESNTGKVPSLFAISTCVETIVLTTRNEFWGYSAEDGSLLWNLTLTYPVAANEAFNTYGVDDIIVFDCVDATFHCYSMITGDELWVSDSYADSPWATTWTVYVSETNDYENLYLALPDGTISALNLETGNEVWRSEPIASTEYPNNVVPYVQGVLMVGGNIYAYAGYSIGYLIDPIPRQSMLVCIDATTGEIKYTLNGGVFPEAAANGYVIGTSIFDGMRYCIGKGPTSTSIIIQDDVVAKGDTVLIKGNVLDQSPASQEYDSQVLFPNGVPAVADEDMNEFMDYLYMQNATLLNNPPTPKGVQVTLTGVDPSGNTVPIGTTTTDSEGNYAINFVPDTTGIYSIKATFEGTDSYWPSNAGTHLSVIPAVSSSAVIEPEEPTPETPEEPETTEEPETPETPEDPETPEEPIPEEPETTAETPLISTELAIIIAVAVAVACAIGIVSFWAIKIRK